MVENLLALPTNAKQVRNIQSAAILFGKYWGKEDTMLEELDDMIKTVEAQENRFYQDIKCNSYEGLLEKMKEIPDSGFQSLLPGGKIF